MSEQECQRCGAQAHDVDNIIERQFWGAIERETETVTSRRVRVLSTTIYDGGHDTRALWSDEREYLCLDCWGLLIGRFMQGRCVDAMPGKETW
jgi:hypothetical protein